MSVRHEELEEFAEKRCEERGAIQKLIIGQRDK